MDISAILKQDEIDDGLLALLVEGGKLKALDVDGNLLTPNDILKEKYPLIECINNTQGIPTVTLCTFLV